MRGDFWQRPPWRLARNLSPPATIGLVCPRYATPRESGKCVLQGDDMRCCGCFFALTGPRPGYSRIYKAQPTNRSSATLGLLEAEPRPTGAFARTGFQPVVVWDSNP